MKNLADLLRNLFYHAWRLRRQPGGVIILVIAALLTYVGPALIAHLEHLYQFMVSFIGSVVVLAFIWHHGNDALEEINKHDRTIQNEARRTGRLIKDFFGLNEKTDDNYISKSKPEDIEPPENS